MKFKFVFLLFAALYFLSCSHSHKTNSRTGLPYVDLDSIVAVAMFFLILKSSIPESN